MFPCILLARRSPKNVVIGSILISSKSAERADLGLPLDDVDGL